MDAGEKHWNIRFEREVDRELNKKNFQYCDGFELTYLHILAWYPLRGWVPLSVHRLL